MVKNFPVELFQKVFSDVTEFSGIAMDQKNSCREYSSSFVLDDTSFVKVDNVLQ